MNAQLAPDDLKLKKTIQLLCSTGVRHSLTMEKVKTWLKQFDVGPEQTLALLILRHLTFRTSVQLRSTLSQALRKATQHFLADAGVSAPFDWRDVIAGKAGFSFLIGPPAHEYTLPGKSGELIVRLIKDVVEIETMQVQYPTAITKLEDSERYLMVDDGTFTGDQLIKVIDASGQFMTNGGKSAIVISIAHETAIQALSARYPNIPVFFGEKITAQDSLTRLAQLWIKERRWAYDVSPIDVYTSVVENKARFESKQPLGYGSLEIMIAYEHGIPDDSLQLLWDKSDTWEPLVGR